MPFPTSEILTTTATDHRANLKKCSLLRKESYRVEIGKRKNQVFNGVRKRKNFSNYIFSHLYFIFSVFLFFFYFLSITTEITVFPKTPRIIFQILLELCYISWSDNPLNGSIFSILHGIILLRLGRPWHDFDVSFFAAWSLRNISRQLDHRNNSAQG